jgi:hypothetical protein
LDEKKTSKTLFSRLRQSQQTVFIRGSATFFNVTPTTIIPSCARLFDATSQHSAFVEVQEAMKKNDTMSEYSPSHLDGLFKQGAMWSYPTRPEYLTVFAAFPTGDISNNMMEMAWDAATKAQNNQDLKDENLKEMRKLHLFAPQNTFDASRALRTYLSLLGLLFGEKSWIYRGIQSHAFWFETNNLRFNWHANQGRLITNFLFGMDQEVQIFLQAISNASVPLSQTPFRKFSEGLDNIRERIIRGQYNQDLPAIFLKPSTDPSRKVYRQQDIEVKKEDPAKKQTPNPPRQPHQPHQANLPAQVIKQKENATPAGAQPNPDSITIVNDTLLDKWKLPQSIRMADLLWRNGAKAPDLPFHNNKQICRMYHLIGRCRNGVGCHFLHGNQKDPTFEAIVDAYVKTNYLRKEDA